MPDVLFYTAAAIGGLFLFFLLMEWLLPLRKATQSFYPRLLLNLVFSALAFATASVIIRPVVASLLDWSDQNTFGLLQILNLSAAANAGLGLLLMDLSFYYWHIATHRIPLLWRFHNVHHLDPDLDVSTGFRFHFGEVVLSAGFRTIQITAIGLSGWTYAIYELLFHANTLFHHSNMRLPIRLERLLNWILVTPRMHGIHHSRQRDEANSNYSVVFSWWDRIHDTVGLDISQSEIEIGVPGYSGNEDNHFWSLVLAPFRRQRDYWSQPDGTSLPTGSRSRRPHRNRLAE